MAGNSHFTSAELARIRAEQEQLAEEHQMRLAAHLAKPCRRCWQALDRLPPADPATVEHPLAQALCRAGDPRSWLGIRREHLRIVRQVRELELGFGFLLLEEVVHRLRDRGDTKEMVRFLWSLADGVPGIDLAARYHWAMARVLLRLDLFDQAENALAAAELASAVAPCPAADLRLLRLDLARSRDRTRHALREMHQLRQLMPSCDPVDRFEIAQGIIDESPLLLDGAFGGKALLSNDAAFALSQLEDVAECSDTVLRLNGLLKKARFAQDLAYVAHLKHGAQVEALGPIAGELEAALPDVESHGDARSLAQFHHLIGCLEREEEPMKAGTHFLAALAAWARVRQFGLFAITLADLASVPGLTAAQREALYDQADIVEVTGDDYEKVLIFFESVLSFRRDLLREREVEHLEVVH